MARGTRTPLPTASLTAAYGEAGYKPLKISEMVGLPESTVEDICSGRHGWNQIMDTPEFQKYRDKSRRALETAFTEMTIKSLRRAGETVDGASFGQAMVGAGISTDKLRALAGESGIEVHLHNHNELTVNSARLEDFLEVLTEIGKQRLAAKQRTIDVTPTPEK